MLARALTITAPDHRRFDDYPTCATTVIDFSGSIAIATGAAVDFTVPRDLISAAGRETD
jgi:phosphohistidine phosphatase